jgi:hypothetical protein
MAATHSCAADCFACVRVAASTGSHRGGGFEQVEPGAVATGDLLNRWATLGADESSWQSGRQSTQWREGARGQG